MTAQIVSDFTRTPMRDWGKSWSNGEPVGMFGWFDADYRRTSQCIDESWGRCPGQLWERVAQRTPYETTDKGQGVVLVTVNNKAAKRVKRIGTSWYSMDGQLFADLDAVADGMRWAL